MSHNRYAELIDEVHELVRTHVPEDAALLVASGGDERLLWFDARRAVDFPDGVEERATTYPPPGAVAVAQLEVQRAWGADFLLIPASELWLLDEYPAFERHLRQRYEAVIDDEAVAVLFALRRRSADGGTVWDSFRHTVDECEAQLGHPPAILDWRTGLDIGNQFPDLPVFSPLEDVRYLPYLDHTIDIVAIPYSAGEAELTEATRVARVAVVKFPGSSVDAMETGRVHVEWNGFMRAPRARPAVVVPCVGSPEQVEFFLASLRDTLQDEPADVLLATEGNVPVAARWAGEDDRTQLLESTPGASLATLCNNAASATSAEIVIFVLPVGCLLPDWLSPLVRTFRDHPKAGAVGGRLLSFRGDVLHAGGHVLDEPAADGETALRACVRPIDYVSPALVATTREIFRELGGFSPDHPTTLFVDYSLRARERGHRVLYQPGATLVVPDGGLEFGATPPAVAPRSITIAESRS